MRNTISLGGDFTDKVKTFKSNWQGETEIFINKGGGAWNLRGRWGLGGRLEG